MNTKISIIGAGNVGATLAQQVIQAGISDVVIYDIAPGVPQGKALDITEAAPLWNVASVCTGTNDYQETAGSKIIVVTAGLPRKPGMSRDDLLYANADIVKAVVSESVRLSPEAFIIVVTNPMDVMAHLALKVSGFDSRRVIGMGGVLDAARFRTFISLELGVAPEDIKAVVLGGHGDQMVPLPRFSTVQGIALSEVLSQEKITELIHRTRNGGAEIVSLLKTGSAYYAPAASSFQMIKAILMDERRVLPCSAYLDGEYGFSDVFAGVPVILGKNGVEKKIEMKLDAAEMADFEKSILATRELTGKVLG